MRSLVLRIGSIVFLSVAISVVAPAQDPRLSGRLDASTREGVEAVIQSARAEGLPVEPLVQRALQGAAKGADGARIVGAVRALAGELRVARQALGARSSAAELVAGAGAMHANVPPGALSRLRASRRDLPLTVPLATLADLISQGVPVDVALRTVSALLERGASDEEVMAARRDIVASIANGESPAAAAESARERHRSPSTQRPRGSRDGFPVDNPGVGRPPAKGGATPATPSGKPKKPRS